MIYVYCLDISKISEEQYHLFYSAAARERQEKADRCRFPEDAAHCIMSDILLKYGFQRYFEKRKPLVCREGLQIEQGANGKPYIKNAEGFCYNLSHSGKWVVLACGDGEMGIDVEKVRENANLERITRRFFTEEERAYIFAPTKEQERRQRFTKIWTGKEGYVKYLGSGLARGLETFSVDGEKGRVKDAEGNCQEGLGLKSWLLEDDYFLSLCSEMDEVQMETLRTEQLQTFL